MRVSLLQFTLKILIPYSNPPIVHSIALIDSIPLGAGRNESSGTVLPLPGDFLAYIRNRSETLNTKDNQNDNDGR